jgi:hypothetical protein
MPEVGTDWGFLSYLMCCLSRGSLVGLVSRCAFWISALPEGVQICPATLPACGIRGGGFLGEANLWTMSCWKVFPSLWGKAGDL